MMILSEKNLFRCQITISFQECFCANAHLAKHLKLYR